MLVVGVKAAPLVRRKQGPCFGPSHHARLASSVVPWKALNVYRDHALNAMGSVAASPSDKAPRVSPAEALTSAWELRVDTSKRTFLKKGLFGTGSPRVRLALQFVGEDGTLSQRFIVDRKEGWQEGNFYPDKDFAGTRHTTTVALPRGFVAAAALLEQLFEPKDAKLSDFQKATYLYSIQLRSVDDPTAQDTSFPCSSFLVSGRRIFFSGRARLPKDTSGVLQQLRQADLHALTGTGADAVSAARKGGDRIYDYQTYNDLGDAKAKKRPTLGGSAALPYPRRIRTGRPCYPGTASEMRVPSGLLLSRSPWMPMDENFDNDKRSDFSLALIFSNVPTTTALLSLLGGVAGASLVSLVSATMRLLFGSRDDMEQEAPERLPVQAKSYTSIKSALGAFDGFNGEFLPVRGPGNIVTAVLYTLNHLVLAILVPIVRFGQGLRDIGDTNGDSETDKPRRSVISRQDLVQFPAPFSLARVKLPANMAPASAAAPVKDASWGAGAVRAALALAGAGAAIWGLHTAYAAAAPPVPKEVGQWVAAVGGSVAMAVLVIPALLRNGGRIKAGKGVRMPRVLCWRTDEEFGRQFLAGINPMVLQAWTRDNPLPSAGAIDEQLVNELLVEQLKAEGSSTQAAGAAGANAAGLSVASLTSNSDKPRLFFVDYHKHFIDAVPAVNSYYQGQQRVQHAGRCVLFLRSDGHLVPLAIDLASELKLDRQGKPIPGEGDYTVYVPPHLAAAVQSRPKTCSGWGLWTLAKAVFMSLDSGYHQLISHFLRTHAAMEPFAIATRRCLSAMHPVYKLMLPHFKYTMPINANARASLINAGGIVESTFTPGKFSMEFSSWVYRDAWQFDKQSLPADLKHRHLLRTRSQQAADGSRSSSKVSSLLLQPEDVAVEDYPYVHDGLLIWNAMVQYFSKYIDLYYKDDNEIAGDEELQNWWHEVRKKGHADKETGWPDLNTHTDMVNILATIAWLGSAHHAAVNFGQYDYGSFMPNHSSLVRLAMPKPGSPEAQMFARADVEDQRSADPDAHLSAEAELLRYLAPPGTALTVASTVKLLSTHSNDETYLSDAKQELLTDPAAVNVHAEFVAAIRASEAVIAQRNDPVNNKDDPKLRSRSIVHSGLPYTYLYASSGPGPTGMGVPYSVSI